MFCSVKLRCSWIYHRFGASNHWFKDHLKKKNEHFCRSFHSYVSLPEGKPSTYWDTPMETYGNYRSFRVFPHFSASKTTTKTPPRLDAEHGRLARPRSAWCSPAAGFPVRGTWPLEKPTITYYIRYQLKQLNISYIFTRFYYIIYNIYIYN